MPKKKSDDDELIELGIGVGQDKFYLNLPYLALIDTDLWKRRNPWSFDIKTLLPDFFEQMKGNLKFKILGKALLSATQLHHAKILWLIQREVKEKEKQEIEKKKRESKELPSLKVPIRRFSEEISKEELMDQLIKVLLDDKKRTERRLKRKKKDKEKQLRQQKRRRRVPLIEAMGPKDFDYEIDADRMNVKERNEQVYSMAIKLLKEATEAGEDEIRFETLLRALTEMATDPRILMARILLSVLFLISDGLLYAEQDVDTKQIFIMFVKVST
ncbi:MAG: hypothetical protein HWN67_14785 [Candidatus Helarchaeota archaeon]|nr:hypothetical protein [Candidatus Helarchaeota archaeon]